MNLRWFSEQELKDLDEFITKHVTELNCYKNNNPEHKSLGFTINRNWSGIGISTFITCNCCGERRDCTDYSVW